MDWKLIFTAFATLLLAELGDKTQLAVLSLSAKTGKPLSVFVGAAVALVFITLIAAFIGVVATRVVPADYLRKGAASLFVFLGVLMFLGKI